MDTEITHVALHGNLRDGYEFIGITQARVDEGGWLPGTVFPILPDPHAHEASTDSPTEAPSDLPPLPSVDEIVDFVEDLGVKIAASIETIRAVRNLHATTRK